LKTEVHDRVLSSRTVVPAFAATLFISAGLMFLVEPMVAKMVLPRLGGSPAVWSTCLVFFQATLLLGYGYAHALTRLLPDHNFPASRPFCPQLSPVSRRRYGEKSK
jgi:hypothetical protein